jgi:excisionase family DNA binding protein
MTIQDAAEFLHLTVPTLYAKVHHKEIPFLKKSKRLYFQKSALIDYLSEK